jgi:nitroimidazol reductase NimA-like FMN-containing flavoprotein (pyridoxamine 5'-phosphate oxidase superfamily)
MSQQPRRMDDLSRAESLRLLGTISFGRVVYTHRSLPAIRPVNHLMDGETIIIRTSEWSELVSAVIDGAVIAYEADNIDLDRHVGWSVVARGPARAVSDVDEADRYRERLISWAAGQRDFVIRIEPVFVTGMRLVEADPS